MSYHEQTPAERAREAAEGLARALRRGAEEVDRVADWAALRELPDEAQRFYLDRSAALDRRAHLIEYHLKYPHAVDE